MPVQQAFGLLVPREYEHAADIMVRDSGERESILRAAKGGWTHRIWNEAALDNGMSFTEATRDYLAAAMGSTWFYLLVDPTYLYVVGGAVDRADVLRGLRRAHDGDRVRHPVVSTRRQETPSRSRKARARTVTVATPRSAP